MDSLEVQDQVLALLRQLPVGRVVTIPGRGGWHMDVAVLNTGAEFDFLHQCPTEDARQKFFTYSTVGNPYGAGKIVQEPSLGVSFADASIHIEVAPKTELAGRIIGAIVLDSDGKVVGRFSWSNLVFAKKQTFAINTDSELFVDGVSQGFVHAVFLPDKNRMDGYVGVFKPGKPETVKVLEMETLLFASI